ncbi:DUF3037 domain-containing protein [uncultured Roseobacter sp.]|uniref:DUF3037 domain-containing protein n=1 Tax=uncultured Roseobacter sp. TaxID=114847 RepID=UPI00262F48D4|nr:DUF3037 domain-containing protein [uncultured Roseobacter sp.]
MKKNLPYSYVVLRYVHDVVSSEFVNVGVVLLSPDEGVLRFKTRKTVGRIKHVFPDLDRQSFVETMRSIDKGLRALKKHVSQAGMFAKDTTAETYALRVLPKDDSSLQWSRCGSGIGPDTGATLERLFSRHVGKYDSKSRARRTDEDVWRPVKDTLKQRGLEIPLQTKTVAGATDKIEFGRAWKNGSWHAYEAISMDLADAEGIKDKARRWRGHLDAVADGQTEDVDLHILLGKPQSHTLMTAFDNAKGILAGSSFGVEVFEESEVDRFVDDIEDEFRAHLSGD